MTTEHTNSYCPESAQKKLSLFSGLLNWLNEVEVFAMLFAAAIHDYEHTGTTNTFHVQTRSNLGTLQLLTIYCNILFILKALSNFNHSVPD